MMRDNAFNNDAEGSTENDAAIARAIAESEQHSHSHAHVTTSPSIAPQHQTSTPNCPGKHGLELFQASNSQRVTCNGCREQIREGDPVWSCVECNVDSCESCYLRGSQLVASTPPQSTSSHNGTSNSRTIPSPTPNVSPSSQFNNPFAARTSPSSHMCLILCSVGSITVEMLVDTGAQCSVLSMPLVNQLGLTNRLDRRYQGVAAGVGRARISGQIRNVVCAFGVGHVEFLMDFTVLDVKDLLVIIGLDQLRKYKCLVDMEREKLIFGGAGGVEVEMLPADQARFDIRSLNGGCTMM
mmetsp:Transcript_3569/g.7885  ORF Transcript_3569/g.7885 Transcript_3569/m.7885 type:complete len:297 (+) Transcript_3569:140-1030(+)